MENSRRGKARGGRWRKTLKTTFYPGGQGAPNFSSFIEKELTYISVLGIQHDGLTYIYYEITTTICSANNHHLIWIQYEEKKKENKKKNVSL